MECSRTYTNYFSSLDSDSQILNQTFGILKHLKYDKNTIHTSEKKDYDNASEKKAQVLEREHIHRYKKQVLLKQLSRAPVKK